MGNRTDMKHHALPFNPFPRWAFDLWAIGCGDCVACEPSMREDFTRWKLMIWSVRGPLFRWLFGWWWWI